MMEFKFTTENYELLRFLHKELIKNLDETNELEFVLMEKKRDFYRLSKKINELTNKIKLNENEDSKPKAKS
ncbi:MAG: hypothetical protein PHW95_02570 [Patescibacteria group bacterium]|nr:hypothetical protein [Patescibacteria group bacterium]